MSRTSHHHDQITGRVARWLDGSTRLQTWREEATTDRWARLFGQVALASLAVCLLTGVSLLFFYRPSVADVDYAGSYAPLRGVSMSRALESTLHLSLEVRGGLLLRQLHHWSASLLIVSLLLQILRVFFTGAHRRPRRTRWVLLFLTLFVTMGEGLTGTALPLDLLSGSSLAVLDGVLKSIPFVGTGLSQLLFRGQFPGGAIAVFYVAHVVLLPAAFVGLLLVHLRARRRRRAAGPPRPRRATAGATARPGTALAAMAHTGGLLLVIAAGLTLIAATVTINPVWEVGPADPGNATAGAGSSWYLAFLDGAQRLVPSGWEVVWLDRTWAFALLVPVAVATGFLAVALAYPFVEAWALGDRRSHLGTERAREDPTRTAIGAAGIAFYGVLWAAGGSDHLALAFSWSSEDVVLALQLGLVVAPVSAFAVTRRICLGLQRRDREVVLHGHETGRIIRMASGEFREVHRPVTAVERARLLPHGERAQPLPHRERRAETVVSGGGSTEP